MTLILRLISLFVLLTACGSDDDNQAPAGPPPEMMAFNNWVEETPDAMDSIISLSSLAYESQTSTGVAPSFFVEGALMKREERDNVQNGYIYPLYFATQSRDFPFRFWDDGYTVQKNNPSDEAEAKKMIEIRKEMTDFWGTEQYQEFFRFLSNYQLIDVRYYSLKPQPPLVAETCFTVRWESSSRGTINYCYAGHRVFQNSDGSFPAVRWSAHNVNGDPVEAFKLFVVALASYEVVFSNPDNRQLRDIFTTNERLSVQMNKANEAFDGIFQYYVDQLRYLDGRQ